MDDITNKTNEITKNQKVYFKVKKTTKLKKLMDAYCARVGKEAGSIRFLFDGDRIAPDSTPNDLGMEDEDEIDAMVEVCW